MRRARLCDPAHRQEHGQAERACRSEASAREWAAGDHPVRLSMLLVLSTGSV
jgi:hypothetical protein